MAEIFDDRERNARVTTDERGFFQAVSPQFLALIDRKIDRLAGASLTDLVHPNDAAFVRQMLTKAQSGPVGGVTVRIFSVDEQWMPVVASAKSTIDGTIAIIFVGIGVGEVSAVPPVAGLGRREAARPITDASASLAQELPEPPSITPPDDVSDDDVSDDDVSDDDAPDDEVSDDEVSDDEVSDEDVSDDEVSDDDGSDLDAADDGEPDHEVVERGRLATKAVGGSNALGRAEINEPVGGSFPPPSVAEERAVVRARVGAVPMIEFNAAREPVMIGRGWEHLTESDAVGIEVFDELVAGSGRADQINSAIDRTLAEVAASRTAVGIAGQDSQWLHALPLPSPDLEGSVHVLVALTPVAEIDSSVTRAVAVPSTDGTAPREGSAIAEPATTTSEFSHQDRRTAPAQPDADAQGEAAESESRSRRQRRPLTFPTTAPVDMIEGGRTGVIVLSIVSVLAGYVGLQGLYLGPAFGWSSPVQGALNSQRCLVQPLCNNGVLTHNHVGVIALVISLAAVTLLFRRAGPRVLATDRPDTAAELAATSWQFDMAGPGGFGWLSVVAIGFMTFQTVLTDSVSVYGWIAATGFGGIAAWRADRDSGVQLASTLAALSLALACLLVPLGIGAIWLGARPLVGAAIAAVGLMLFTNSLRLNLTSTSSFDVFDFAAMFGLSIVAVVLGLARHRTWRYAFIGDEWTFFEGARDSLRGQLGIDTFDIGGPNDYFTGLTFELQASVMQVAGDDVWGWRLSALLPMVLSVAAMYAFTRWLAGRTAAMAAAIALAAGHMLLSFSMIGYNNSQSLVAVSASFAALAWAHQRPSALRFFLLGSAVGSTFLVYAMARLALIPLAILFLVLFRNDLASLRRRLGWSLLGGLAMATPALFSWQNWQALIKATPIEAEAAVLEAGSVTRQVVENTLAGWLSFIGSTQNSHFIVGPHLDLVSAILMVIGVGFVLARAGRDSALRAFIIGGVVLWTLINAVQQYAQISHTRSFMLPLLYSVFVGVAVAALMSTLRAWKPALAKPAAGVLALAVLGLGLVGLNQWHIGSYANSRQSLSEVATLVQQFEETAGIDDQGMQVHFAWPQSDTALISTVLRAHSIGAERIASLPFDGDLNVEALCSRVDPVQLVVHHDHPRVDEWTSLMSQCWETPVVRITDPAGGPKLISVSNPAGVNERNLDPSERAFQPGSIDDYELDDVVDLATDANGVVYALVQRAGGGAAIHRLDGGGSFELTQRQVIDFDITSDGLFIVAGIGADDRLVWYDGAGQLIRRWDGRDEIASIGGLAVSDDVLWVSDFERGRVVAFNADFKLETERFGQGLLVNPAAIAIGPAGSVWVASSGTGEIVLVNADDTVTVRVAGDVVPPDNFRLSSTRDGSLLRPVRSQASVQLISRTGALIDVRSGVLEPQAAVGRGEDLVVNGVRWNQQSVIGGGFQWEPAPRAIVTWAVPSIVGDELRDLTSPFVPDGPGPGLLEVALTETTAAEVRPGLTWRELGIGVVGELQGVSRGPNGFAVGDVNGRIVRLDPTGRTMDVVGLDVTGSTFLTDLGIGPDGTIWALDGGSGLLHRVDADANVTTVGSGVDGLLFARGLGATSRGSVWVASTATTQLIELDGGGTVVASILLEGRQPSDVVEAADATLWFVDAEQLSLTNVAFDGTVLRELPLAPFTSLESPHLAIDGDVLWVTHPEESAVLLVDLTTGAFIDERIDLTRPDGGRVDKAVGIAVGPDGELWITDSRAGAVLTVDP